MNEKLKELEHIMSNNEYVQFWIPEIGAETYETIYFKDAFEETTTPSAGMEAEQEIELCNGAIVSTTDRINHITSYNLDGKNTHKNRQVELCGYILSLLKSRRDALISQQVIR